MPYLAPLAAIPIISCAPRLADRNARPATHAGIERPAMKNSALPTIRRRRRNPMASTNAPYMTIRTTSTGARCMRCRRSCVERGSALRDGRRVHPGGGFLDHVLGQQIPADEMAAGAGCARFWIVVLVHPACRLEIGNEQHDRLVGELRGFRVAAVVQKTVHHQVVGHDPDRAAPI